MCYPPAGSALVNLLNIFVELDRCSSKPCMNMGTCLIKNNNMYTCTCLPEHTGLKCEEGLRTVVIFRRITMNVIDISSIFIKD